MQSISNNLPTSFLISFSPISLSQRRPSLADTRGRQASLELSQDELQQQPVPNQENSYESYKSLENDPLFTSQQKSLEGPDLRPRPSSFERGPTTGSFERGNSSFERLNSADQPSAGQQPRASVQSAQKMNNQLLQRRRSSMSKRQPLGQRPSLTTPAPIALPRTLDSGCSEREQILITKKLPRKSYSASDSSLDELLDPTMEASVGEDDGMQYTNSGGQLNQTQSPRASDDEDAEESNLTNSAGRRLSRSVHQLSTTRRQSRRSNTSPLSSQPQLHQLQQQSTLPSANKMQQYNVPDIHTSQMDTTSYQPMAVGEPSGLGKSNSSTMLTRNTSPSIRRPASARIRKQSAYFTYEPSAAEQQANSAGALSATGLPQTTIRRQSDSQGSEGSEPIDNSLSLSSPDYSRSPRQSADSDILGLRK